jgi:hypothetical protein
MREELVVVEVIPYRKFRERIRIVREVLKERPRVVEIHSKFVYIEREERAS